MTRRLAIVACSVLAASSAFAKGKDDATKKAPEPKAAPAGDADDPLAKYFSALEQMKLIDVESGNLESLKRELAVGEKLLTDGAFTNAAVALYAIVRSPRYASFTEFVEYQNAEYDLAVALARAGAYGASLEVIEGILKRGPAAPYWGPAHRRAVDIAIETRDHAGVLARIEAIKTNDPIPPSAAGERSYLRGRAAYENGKLTDAQGELALISKKSRLYSSAVYLRGVIWARKGELKSSAEAMCEIAATEDNSKFTFVVDDRYFTVKDLARLGLGRLAHEQGEYDDAYYHYFQIPDDSLYLSDALFEASWSMYQKRELATARDLVHEFLRTFPSSPLWPEASLLAGYTELADCKFDDSQKWYDGLVARLQPIVDEIDRARHDPELRKQLFAKALSRYREIKDTGQLDGKKIGTEAAKQPIDDVVALLRLDPKFLRLNDAVTGIHELAATAPQATRQWQNLASQVGETKVQKISTTKTLEQEQLADANATVEDMRRLEHQVSEQKDVIARARREGTMDNAEATAEEKRLDELHGKVAKAVEHAVAAADTAAQAVSAQATAGIKPLLEADIKDARRLDKSAHALAVQLDEAGDKLAELAIERLYQDTRKVLDKAKLGKVDAVIGQKRKLDIEVQDLAAGRFPEELRGRLWNASMIGDDEEFWPFQGEYWADEYEGFR
ncbi:MAG TPA: tetratricopeptide repeat protein [Kofleriaceae bacterium]|nr:tetratricopeptide repeat protein [Kofleriaceae bacterium]